MPPCLKTVIYGIAMQKAKSPFSRSLAAHHAYFCWYEAKPKMKLLEKSLREA
jgi:hypothetical protein